MNLLRLAIAAVFLAVLNPAAAQWQTPTHSVPIGQGAGVTGFGSAAPGAAGLPLVSNGPTSDPAFQAMPGVFSNTLFGGAVQTSTLTVNSAACGTTIALGGNVQFTLTVGVASGFPATCVIGVVNIDAFGSGRGKIMAINGVTFPLQVLYPGMSFTLVNENNAWVLFGLANRAKAPATTLGLFTDFANGLDTNDGLAAGAGNAKKTAQACLDTIGNDFDFAGWSGISGEPGGPTLATCNMLAGSTDTQPVHFATAGVVGAAGAAAVLLQGNGGVATLQPASGDVLGLFLNSRLQLKNLTLATTNGNLLSVGYAAEAQILSGVTFGSAGTGAHMNVSDNGIVRILSGYSITGSAAEHISAQAHGQVANQGGTITVTGGAQAFTFFAIASNGGLIAMPNTTYSGMGSATGKRTEADNLGNIATNVGAVACQQTYFPGNVNGTLSGGGQCN